MIKECKKNVNISSGIIKKPQYCEQLLMKWRNNVKVMTLFKAHCDYDIRRENIEQGNPYITRQQLGNFNNLLM